MKCPVTEVDGQSLQENTGNEMDLKWLLTYTPPLYTAFDQVTDPTEKETGDKTHPCSRTNPGIILIICYS